MVVCAFCRRSDDIPEEYGEFMEKSGICVHYYCMIFSTSLPQRGADHAGILGFLARDIRKEIKDASERVCIYCAKVYANVACHTCKKYFHYVCGNENDCSFEFINEFRAYCHDHVPYKNEVMLQGMGIGCWVCHEPLGLFNPVKILRAYCCEAGYVHRRCMRRYALSAGYYLRCLWCGKKDFRDDVRRHGVFVPDREACWDNNNTLRYNDLHSGYSRCDAKNCDCPQGREYCKGKWKLKICSGCGAAGIHQKCAGAASCEDKYTCDVCADVLNQNRANEEKRKSKFYLFDSTLYISKIQEGCSPLSANASSSLSPERPTPSKTMYLFTENMEIAGLGVLKSHQTPDKIEGLPCNSRDLENFAIVDPCILKIFHDIKEENRELSLDIVDEVVSRLRTYCEVFGDH